MARTIAAISGYLTERLVFRAAAAFLAFSCDHFFAYFLLRRLTISCAALFFAMKVIYHSVWVCLRKLSTGRICILRKQL